MRCLIRGKAIGGNRPVGRRREAGFGILLGLALFVFLQEGGAWAQPVLFHSPLDNGVPTVVPAVIAEGGSGSLFLYLQTQGPASSDPQEICVRADGAEVCAANLAFTASGTLTFFGSITSTRSRRESARFDMASSKSAPRRVAVP